MRGGEHLDDVDPFFPRPEGKAATVMRWVAGRKKPLMVSGRREQYESECRFKLRRLPPASTPDRGTAR